MADEIVLEKKKKKTKAPKLDEVTDGVEALDLKPKKKKEKKPKAKNEDDAAEAETPAPEDGEKKKKKKKEKKDDASGPTLDLDLTQKKKKKKKDPKDGEGKKKKNQDVAVNRIDQMADELTDKADFGYEACLDRVFEAMAAKGVGKGDREVSKIIVKPPKMSRMGTKKTVYENFGQTCADLNRDPKHVLNYILVEIGTTGNITDKGGFVIRGKFTSAQMEKILKPYIKEYVLCKTCKRANTTLSKTDRLTFMDCQDCSSRTTVAVTKKGFEALTGKRKKIKLQQGGDAKLAAIK